jgi:predicted component of type VI protein secretion system
MSIDGNDNRTYVNNFVDKEFLSVDSLEFRKYLTSITPDIEMTTTYTEDSGEESEVTVPMTVQFFWPDS